MSDDVIPVMLCGAVALTALVGIVAFTIFGRPSRVERARRAGEPEESIQRGLATIKRVRDLCWIALVGGVLGAAWFLLAARSG